MIRARQPDAGVAIELTPIIDMVFLLLIFFLVATTFHQTEREMQIALPASVSAGPISAALREIIVNVDAEGQIIVNGSTMELETLRGILEDAIAVNPEQKVTVRGDRNTAYANVVRVLDVCKGSGIQEPYLDTVIDVE
ncbi:MAG: ExbD/TolR family protein [Planctomycetota bacterium]|jgi:biopolymer transport protein ExbD